MGVIIKSRQAVKGYNMGIRNYLKNNSITVTRLHQKTGIPYMTLSDIINGRTAIDHTSVSTLVRLSDALGMDMSEVYKLCREDMELPELKCGELAVKKGRYYLSYKGATYYLCRANEINRFYLDFMAERKVMDIDRKELLEAWN